MRCIVCDRCGKIIEDVKRHRVITCARPLKPPTFDKPPHRGSDPLNNEILWEKELCSDCVDALDTFMEYDDGDSNPDDGSSVPSGPDNGDTDTGVDPSKPGGTDPDEPGNTDVE